MENKGYLFSKKKIISGIGIFTILLLGKKGYDLSAPQIEEKICDWNYPIKIDAKDITYVQNIIDNRLLTNVVQQGGYINDASCLNKTAIYAIVSVKNIEDIQSVIRFAKKNNLKITAKGVGHSMGGQSLTRGGIVLNMDNLNSMEVDGDILSVGAGAKWSEVQKFLDPQGLAVKAMQSINIFSVGGTISVNAHGIAHSPGPIASTIQSITIVDSEGIVKKITPENNPQLFGNIIGGYGLFGVIVSTELKVVPNEVYDWSRIYMDTDSFYEYYTQKIKGNSEIGLFYGRISLSPTTYMTEASAHVYKKIDTQEVHILG